ncbi:MAG: radical SAM protein [Thermodesulfobacteriota bacterium]
MKVCLVNPPFTERFCRSARWQASSKGTALWMPIWLIYATGVLEQAGHVCRLIDSPARRQSRRELIEEVRRFEPGLTVIYTATTSIHNDLEIAGLLKQARPEAKTAAVGPHVSVLPEESLRIGPGLDFVIRREFDHVLPRLADCLENNGRLEDVPGLSWLEDGACRQTGEALPLRDLDALPFSIQVIEKHLDIYDYRMDYLLYPWVQTYFGRGCAGRCVFCLWPQTFLGHTYRTRGLDSLMAELEYLDRRAPHVRELMIDDDSFTRDTDRVARFCEQKLTKGYDLRWTANVRPTIRDVAFLKLMKRAGCRAVVAGYESGSPEILKRIRKGITLDRMEDFARACREAGLQVHGDFIIGLPGENRKTVVETLEAALKLKPDTMQVSLALPLPGTEFYRWAKENGHLKTEDYSRFLDENGAQNVLVEYGDFSEADMKQAMYRILRRYYLRPGYIAGALGRIARDPHEAVKFWHAGLRFARYLVKGP